MNYHSAHFVLAIDQVENGWVINVGSGQVFPNVWVAHDIQNVMAVVHEVVGDSLRKIQHQKDLKA